jgi:hypothetical protein
VPLAGARRGRPQKAAAKVLINAALFLFANPNLQTFIFMLDFNNQL